MVAQLLRLRLDLGYGAVRGRVWRIAGAIVAGIALIIVLWWLFGAIASLADIRPENARSLLVVIGSFSLLGYLTVPAMLGIRDPIDPRAFALYGIAEWKLAAGLLAASLVSVPGLILIALCAATIATWARGGLSATIAVVCAALAVITCTLLARIVELGAGAALLSRRSREIRLVFLLLILVLIAPAIIFVLGIDWSSGSGLVEFGRAAGVVSWTPFGAVWAAPGDAAAGNVAGALLKTLIALATAAVLYLIWWSLVAKTVHTAPQAIHEGNFGSLGWFDVLPARAAGVIAARSLSYWGRDARYIVSILIIPVLPFLLIPPLLIAGVPAQPLALVPLPVMCLFLGWSLHNDLAFDSSAVWLHVASGVKGSADRLGRIVPTVLLGIPLLVIGAMISTAFFGSWAVLPAMFGVSCALLLNAIGISSYLSATSPYPAAAPGDSPFQQPQSTGSRGGFSQALGLILPVLLALPAIFFAGLGLAGQPDAYLLSLLIGVGTGLVVLVAGVWAGGRAFDRRGPEIIEFATSH
ncbi:ABC-2 type transport system permease protein [Paramicrobacterium humi]|uniref:ABC-2 type transport system permease protein n=1 Tax=Paramicrobacterium humi TaxID=640635 RepID=A0A1H4TCF6_9MICO|nr:hypothetical protein [Microbacterium humi]SEC53834.1 ABC-2 type transport system permease protein [Microbacterium humi]